MPKVIELVPQGRSHNKMNSKFKTRKNNRSRNSMHENQIIEMFSFRGKSDKESKHWNKSHESVKKSSFFDRICESANQSFRAQKLPHVFSQQKHNKIITDMTLICSTYCQAYPNHPSINFYFKEENFLL